MSCLAKFSSKVVLFIVECALTDVTVLQLPAAPVLILAHLPKPTVAPVPARASVAHMLIHKVTACTISTPLLSISLDSC